MAKLRHHDGWYNGNPDHMIPNGTYADFRDIIVRRVENGFFDKTWGKGRGAAKLAEWDKQWEAIPIEQRRAAREVVIQDSTPMPTIVEEEGSGRKIRALRARPSAGNNLEIGRFERDRVKTARGRKLPAEPLSSDNEPVLDISGEVPEKKRPGRPRKDEPLSSENGPLAPSA